MYKSIPLPFIPGRWLRWVAWLWAALRKGRYRAYMCQSCPAHTCIPSCWLPVCPFAVKLVGPWRRFPGRRRVFDPARLAELRSGRLLGVPWPSPGRPRRSARPGRGLGPWLASSARGPRLARGQPFARPGMTAFLEKKSKMMCNTRAAKLQTVGMLLYRGYFFVPGMLLYPWELKGAVQKHS